SDHRRRGAADHLPADPGRRPGARLVQRDQHRRGDPPGARARPRPHHRHRAGRWRPALSVEAVQPGVPAFEEPAGAGVAGVSVIELFREDSYLATCEAVVTAIGEKGIEFDRTIFYPTGGGQPGDRGTLVLADGREIAVVD